MKTKSIVFYFILILIAQWSSISCSKKSDEMLIVVQKSEQGDAEVRAFGKIRIEYGKAQIWKQDQLVFFRCDAKIEGESGAAGTIYRLNEDLKLHSAASCNTGMSLRGAKRRSNLLNI